LYFRWINGGIERFHHFLFNIVLNSSFHAMYTRVIFTVLVLFYLMEARAQKFILNSYWRDSTITIDGNADDWAQPFPYFDSKTRLQYSVVNDDKYIYISVRTNDDKAQMKIMRAGMDVWFDVNGKKKEVATVHFPLKNNTKLDITNDPNEPDQQIIERPDVKKMKMEWAESLRELHTQGMKVAPENYMMTDSGRHEIEAALSWDRDNTLTYELKVPFSAFYKDAITAADAAKPITIGIKAYAMDLPLIPTNASTDMTGITSSPNPNGMNANGLPNTVNSGRPQTSMPSPSMAIPKSVADMGVSLVVTMKIKLAFR
jgi:hypothetical protein